MGNTHTERRVPQVGDSLVRKQSGSTLWSNPLAVHIAIQVAPDTDAVTNSEAGAANRSALHFRLTVPGTPGKAVRYSTAP